MKSTYLVAVDDGAYGEHDIFIRCSEVEVGGEAPIIPESTLSQARPTFEREAAVIEDASFGEQVKKVILRDVEQRCVVGVGPAHSVAGDQRARELGHRYAFPMTACSGATRASIKLYSAIQTGSAVSIAG